MPQRMRRPLRGAAVDERRHNMDGALFVDEERQSRAGGRESRRSRSDDGKADDARRVTQGILDRMDLEASARIREDDEDRIVIDVEGPDAGRAIGKKGMTLEALQFLVNKIVNRDPDERRHIVLDSGDYRERHDNSLVSMAKREAKRAVTTGRPVTLEPMSARDRRVIHVSLAKFPGVSTRSEGEGTERRLQIIPARGSERGGDRRDSRGGRSSGRDDRSRSGSRDRASSAATREARSERSRERLGSDRIPGEDRLSRPRPLSEERAREERAPARDDRARDDRARDDRARDERPRDERPRDDRPRDERPRDDRPRDERAPAGRERPTADDWSRGRDDASRDERPRDNDRNYDRNR